jgi:glyoxylase-like metal-dependent hydrolase (beta-lactamase superfamily II)
MPRLVKETFAADQPRIGKPLNMGIFKMGSVIVTPLLDTPRSFELSLFKGADEAEMLKAAGTQPIPAAVNVFLVERGKERILIDTGIGTMFPGITGQLPECLEEVKVPVNDVSKIFITHMHLDHIGGMIHDGKPAYPRAQVYISQVENDYWMSDAAMNQAPEAKRGQFQRIREVMRILKEHEQKIIFFKLGDVISPDVQSLDLTGHTPGHSGFRLKCKTNTLLFVGDLLHGAALQMPRPDINADFDIDQAKAKETRLRTFKQVTKEPPIAGAHLPFPGMNVVLSEGNGYKLVDIGSK